MFNRSTQLHAQDSVAAQIVKLGADAFQKAKAPGLLVATLRNGKTDSYLWGYADSAQQKRFDLQIRFEAASITKTFTAFVVAKVLAQKNIADTASILPYLPDSLQQNKALSSISFLSLLNHTSGLPRLPDNFKPANPAQPYADYSVDRLFAYLKTAVPKPNGKSNYSNTGAALAGVLAQRLSGKTFPELLHHYIYKPFGIIIPRRGTKIQQAKGYMDKQPVDYWKWDAFEPTGGIQCSAHQLLQYLHYLDKPKNKKEAAFINHFLQPTVRINPTVQVARGWHTLEKKGKPVVYWHNGGTYGFSTFAAFVPGTGKAVVVVANKFDVNEVSDKLGFDVLYTLLQ